MCPEGWARWREKRAFELTREASSTETPHGRLSGRFRLHVFTIRVSTSEYEGEPVWRCRSFEGQSVLFDALKRWSHLQQERHLLNLLRPFRGNVYSQHPPRFFSGCRTRRFHVRRQSVVTAMCVVVTGEGILYVGALICPRPSPLTVD